jgi:guanylate kinase
MQRAITCTTRAPRKGETDGVDYYFLKADDFLRRVQAGNFLEHATVYGNSYGLLKSELLGKLRAGQGRAAERGCPGRGDHSGRRGKPNPNSSACSSRFF